MDEIEEIKHRIDIVELISSYLTVKKTGANFRAVCPFHQEKTPSFMISQDKQIFKCFGCQAGGDIFEFVMKMENLEFREALEMLAQRAGVKLVKKAPTEFQKQETNRKTKLFKINLIASQVFNKILMEHPSAKAALDYLKNRGLDMETIKDFSLGYAPYTSILGNFLKQKGFTETEINEAGNPVRFFKRIIFPIRDVMGNTVGFTGRVTEKGQEPKYLNTPETPIFHKGRILYNLDKARGEIKLQDAVVVVEGQMDVISSYRAGVKNVVASSGTALTTEHLQILYRYTPNIIFSFDSDTAGLATAKKAYEMALEQGMNAKMVSLGDFKDPGEMVEKDPEVWQKAVKEARPVIDWYFEIAFKGKGEGPNKELTPQEKKEIAKEILPVIAKIPDSIEQAHYIGKLAKKLQVPDKIIYDSLNKLKLPLQTQKNTAQSQSVKNNLNSEEVLIGLILNKLGLMETVSIEIKADYLQNEMLRALYMKLVNWYNKNRQEDPKSFLSDLSEEELKRAKFLSLEVSEKYPLDQEKIILDVMGKIKSDKAEGIKKYYAEAISLAEESGDRPKLQQLMKEFQDAISK